MCRYSFQCWRPPAGAKTSRRHFLIRGPENEIVCNWHEHSRQRQRERVCVCLFLMLLFIRPSVVGAGRTHSWLPASNAHGAKIIFGTRAATFYLWTDGPKWTFILCNATDAADSRWSHVCSTQAHAFQYDRNGVVYFQMAYLLLLFEISYI